MTVTKEKRTTQTNRKLESELGVNQRIHFADGNKGGVGKSVLCRTLYQWFLDRKHPVIGIEADVNSPDFKGIYGDVKVAQFSEDETIGARANTIVNTVVDSQKNAVVNLPATVYEAFRIWLRDYDILTLAADNHIELVKWFVVTGEFDSLKSLEISLKTFDRRIPHVVVKNLKYADWSFFDEADELQALIQETQTPVIELPKLPVRVASTVLQQRLTYADSQTYRGKGFGVVEQAAVKSYLRSAYAAFESTGYLPGH
ncbi:MAG: hypothetical protein F6K11_16745 [Leptolyngbya sp. SIO3F4]|nr:hypothetical protein [Leptolyngbya sp. SIO3F4]